MEEFSVSVQAFGDVTLVRARGDIDLYSAPTLRTQLLELIAAGQRCLVVDLSEVTFLDSSGLGVLVGALKRVRADDGWVRLVCPDERLFKLFRVTGLTKAFTIHATTEAAISGDA